MASNLGGTGSSITAVDVAPGTLTNLFGTATPIAGAGTFNPNTPDSYNNSTSLTVYDSKGTQHIASLYFQKSSPNVWNAFLTVDSTVVPAAGTPLATLNFDTAGRLVTVTPAAPSTQGTTLKTVISDPTYTPVGANPLPLAFDFAQTTQYGGAFGVNSLTQDGYTSGELSGFSTSTDGTIVGRYTNGQTQSLGQIGLVNFTNPQGLQPVGNNEWVETPESGIIPLNKPGSSGLGLLQSSAVEDSNVDLTAELVNMITAQRVYQANAQTIKTQDQVLQTLVNLR
ncbi:MAG: flagellar hook-basal body complex protein [Gallionella sp.]|nr:flagellar hook-basal body complex protein [Gallionella sp.]